jgi:hypothetical protein
MIGKKRKLKKNKINGGLLNNQPPMKTRLPWLRLILVSVMKWPCWLLKFAP